jgi:hypothetical protein
VIALSAMRVPAIAFIDRNSAGIFVVAIIFPLSCRCRRSC